MGRESLESSLACARFQTGVDQACDRVCPFLVNEEPDEPDELFAFDATFILVAGRQLVLPSTILQRVDFFDASSHWPPHYTPWLPSGEHLEFHTPPLQSTAMKKLCARPVRRRRLAPVGAFEFSKPG